MITLVSIHRIIRIIHRIIIKSKNFAKKDHYKIDPTQEMMALGLTNMINSFVIGAFTVSAGMSRSTVNYQANAATQISAWITAIVIMIAVGVIAEIFVYIQGLVIILNYILYY